MLITDDDGAFRETLASVFAPRGFHTLLAPDGQEALAIVRRELVHVLLTDMHMPRMSGLEIIRQIRHSQLSLPCILISAAADDGLIEQAGNDVFSILRKPVRFSEIASVVREAMKVTYGWTEEDTQRRDDQ